ncbi:MAG: glycosyltransferase family 39 protein [Verrucomicrobia bacterium]|nr:glycosyltransferase family 39 protein [Verrucomicrobiota bacterium]
MPPSEAGPSPVARSRAPRWFVWLGLVALAGYGVLLATNMSAVAGGSDSSGYLNSARLFAAGKIRTELRVPPEFAGLELVRRHFSPAGFNRFPVHHALAPSYPWGFPLHLALGGRLLGWQVGPFLVQLLAAMAAVWLCYWTARELGLDFALAGAGAAMLAAFPVFIFTSIQTLSDTLATTWSLAALFCALRGRGSHGWAAACGASLAIAVLVRPTNLLIAPALIVLLGFDLRRLGWFVLGGVPGTLRLGLYNHHLYGGALRSGYGDILTAFALEFFRPTAVHFTKWLALFLPAVALALPLAALTHRDTRHRERTRSGAAARVSGRGSHPPAILESGDWIDGRLLPRRSKSSPSFEDAADSGTPGVSLWNTMAANDAERGQRTEQARAGLSGFRATANTEVPHAQRPPAHSQACSKAMSPPNAASTMRGYAFTSLVSLLVRKSFRFAHTTGNGSAFQCVVQHPANLAPRNNPSTSRRV